MLARRNTRTRDQLTLTPRVLMKTLFDDLDDIFGDVGSLAVPPEIYNGIHLSETEDEALNIQIDLPGVKRENLDVKIREGILSISAERTAPCGVSKFSRRWHVSEVYDPETISATLEDGVLGLTIDRRAKTAETTVEVK